VLERECEEHVAGEDRHVVLGRLFGAKVIIFHTWQVVVDERHGVDHLDGAGGGDGGGLCATDELACGDAEHGADPLAAGKEGVAHGFVDLVWVPQRNGSVQGLVYCVGLGNHVALEIEVEHRVLELNFLGCDYVFLSGHNRDEDWGWIGCGPLIYRAFKFN